MTAVCEEIILQANIVYFHVHWDVVAALAAAFFFGFFHKSLAKRAYNSGSCTEYSLVYLAKSIGVLPAITAVLLG